MAQKNGKAPQRKRLDLYLRGLEDLDCHSGSGGKIFSFAKPHFLGAGKRPRRAQQLEKLP